jgi:hypothetical protein
MRKFSRGNSGFGRNLFLMGLFSMALTFGAFAQDANVDSQNWVQQRVGPYGVLIGDLHPFGMQFAIANGEFASTYEGKNNKQEYKGTVAVKGNTVTVTGTVQLLGDNGYTAEPGNFTFVLQLGYNKAGDLRNLTVKKAKLKGKSSGGLMIRKGAVFRDKDFGAAADAADADAVPVDEGAAPAAE